MKYNSAHEQIIQESPSRHQMKIVWESDTFDRVGKSMPAFHTGLSPEILLLSSLRTKTHAILQLQSILHRIFEKSKQMEVPHCWMYR